MLVLTALLLVLKQIGQTASLTGISARCFVDFLFLGIPERDTRIPLKLIFGEGVSLQIGYLASARHAPRYKTSSTFEQSATRKQKVVLCRYLNLMNSCSGGIDIGTLKVDMLAPIVLGRKRYGKCLGEVVHHRPILRVVA